MPTCYFQKPSTEVLLEPTMATMFRHACKNHIRYSKIDSQGTAYNIKKFIVNMKEDCREQKNAFKLTVV
jgi:hypothetical protein